jgi:hypothetical protein
MGPRELTEVGDLVDGLPSILQQIHAPALDHADPNTATFRTTIAELRSKANELVGVYPREAFPLANKAIKRFANKVNTIVQNFPGTVEMQSANCADLQNIWHLEVRPSIYSLELALAVTGGVYLPEDPPLFRGKDRIFRDIALEVNICYRNAATNACSVLLRRLVESLIIKVHENRGTLARARDPVTNRFYKLDRLIDDLTATNSFGLTQPALDALPHLKRLGDWGAHNRNINVRRTDLDQIKDNARLCFEELLHFA